MPSPLSRSLGNAGPTTLTWLPSSLSVLLLPALSRSRITTVSLSFLSRLSTPCPELFIAARPSSVSELGRWRSSLRSRWLMLVSVVSLSLSSLLSGWRIKLRWKSSNKLSSESEWRLSFSRCIKESKKANIRGSSAVDLLSYSSWLRGRPPNWIKLR